MEDKDIVSEPAFREEQVVDIDVSYPSGKCEFTLRPYMGDHYDLTPHDDSLVIELASKSIETPSGPMLLPKEYIVLESSQREWYSIRERTIRWPLNKPPIVPSGVDSDSTNRP